MAQTLRSMSLGDALVFGQYSAQEKGQCPVPIRWLKSTPNCDFITEGVVDLFPLDGMERWPGDYRPKGCERFQGIGYSQASISSGDPRFGVSTLMQFLNSADESWFSAQHEYDAPPQKDWLLGSQVEHYGFLRYFEPYEIEAILPKTVDIGTEVFTSRVRIPTVKDMYGGEERLNLFKKRRGVRAQPTEDLATKIGRSYWATGEKYYLGYFLADMSTKYLGYNAAVGKDSYLVESRTDSPFGVRPMISLNPKTRIEYLGGREYRILPKGAVEMKCSTADEMFAFFGIAQP